MKSERIVANMKHQFSGLLDTGFFHIFGSSTFNKILSVVLSFVLVRVLSKEDYGVYAYAFNIVSFFVLFNGLGVTSAVLQICSELYERKERAKAIYSYAYRAGVCADFFICLLIAAIALFAPLEIPGSGTLLLLYSILPMVSLLFEMKTIKLRVRLENREYAFSLNVQSVLLTVFSLVGAFLFSALGLVVGQLAAYLIAYLFMCAKYPSKLGSSKAISPHERRDFWNISLLSALNSGMSQALSLTGTLFVGQMLADDVMVANYQVATLIPYGLLFIPGALVTYAYPYFARNNKNRAWTLRNYLKLTFGSILINGCIAIGVCLMIEPIINILFGEQYIEIAPIIRTLMVGFFITASFRQPAGNLLITQRKLWINISIAGVVILCNLIANYLLIPIWGLLGAAIAYDLTMMLGAILVTVSYVVVILSLDRR